VQHLDRARDPALASLLGLRAGAGVAGGDEVDVDIELDTEPRTVTIPEELAAALDPARWEVLVADARPRLARDPEGNQITVDDAVLRARRR